MFITKRALPRRTMLRGLGATLALPLLDAMIPAVSAIAKTAAHPVRRFGVVYVPNGMAMEYWTPALDGTTFPFTPVLKALEPFRDRVIVLSGLDLPKDGAPHADASTPFLSGVVGKPSEIDLQAGVSIDQLLAREFGQYTQLGSLELALDGRDNAGSCNIGYSCAYTNTISWRSTTTPVPMENDPRMVFERLFGDGGTTDSALRAREWVKQRSILDSVTDRIRSLQQSVGPADAVKLGQYFEGIRDVERRIQKAEEQSTKELPVVSQPAGVPATFDEHATLMFDLQLLAYQCDLTRVGTLMMGREFSGRTYPEIGVPDAHHPLSHHQDDAGRVALMSKVNAYHVALFAKYLEKLGSTPDGDGSLLDHMVMLYGAGISNSNAHSHLDLPILLAGGGSGALKGGRHIRYPSGTPMANLLMTLMDKMAVPVERLGNSNGNLHPDLLSLG
jgi:hypothetical protein